MSCTACNEDLFTCAECGTMFDVEVSGGPCPVCALEGKLEERLDKLESEVEDEDADPGVDFRKHVP